jgi:hypothetical protein
MHRRLASSLLVSARRRPAAAIGCSSSSSSLLLPLVARQQLDGYTFLRQMPILSMPQMMQQVRFMMYNPKQRKPSNKKKKRKLKRKAQKKKRRDSLNKLKDEQPEKIRRLTYLSLPYPVKLQRVIEMVDGWYDDLALDCTFREVLLQHNGWFPIRFAATRLEEWTNHAILINAFVQRPDRYDIKCLYSIHGAAGDDVGESFLPPMPESFAVEAAQWQDYEFDEEDFQEDDWLDLNTDLDPLLHRLQIADDANDYDALFHRNDYPLERIQKIHVEANQQSLEALQQFPRIFGSYEERHPIFGYDSSATTPSILPSSSTTTTATTTSSNSTTSPSMLRPTDVMAELQRILSQRKQ